MTQFIIFILEYVKNHDYYNLVSGTFPQDYRSILKFSYDELEYDSTKECPLTS